MPHISCVGGSRESIREVLAQYRAHGIRHLVALRGDLPSGTVDAGDFRYASELVAFIREETGDWFHIDVAAYPEYHPQARSPQEDLAAFKRKIDAGADSAITQYFYNADAYWHFVDACRAAGITVPIVPGIMPIGSFTKLARFSDACGAEIPRWIRKKLEGYGDDTASIRAFGLDVVTDLARQLLARGAPGLHFYTLNQAVADDDDLAAAGALVFSCVSRHRRSDGGRVVAASARAGQAAQTRDYGPGMNDTSWSTVFWTRTGARTSMSPPFSRYCAFLSSRTLPRTAGAYHTW